MHAYQPTANIKTQFSLELGFCLMFYTYVVRLNNKKMKHELQHTSLTPFIGIFYWASIPEFAIRWGSFLNSILAASSLKIIGLPEYY